MTDLSNIVKPGQLERIVWSAMVWARENHHPGEVPEYTDAGNSFAEDECRATVVRILSAINQDVLAACVREGLEMGAQKAAIHNLGRSKERSDRQLSAIRALASDPDAITAAVERAAGNPCVIIEIEVQLLFRVNWKNIMAPLQNQRKKKVFWLFFLCVF